MGQLAAKLALAIPLAGLLAACATSSPPPRSLALVQAPPKAKAPPPPAAIAPNPVYKVGDPYQVGGIWYYPREQPDYDETGIASWYGQDYQGKPTANGEIFDRNNVTGAHPTLPIPVNVRVTNLENGRSLVVRVNDRGPYVKGRIIDLSEHAADLLGFRLNGLARVRVTFLGRAEVNGPAIASAAEQTPPEIATAVRAAPVMQVETSDLPAVTGAVVASPTVMASLPAPVAQAVLPPIDQVPDGQVVEMPVPSATALYVQAGSFTSPYNAQTMAAKLQSAGARISPAMKDGRPVYRVRIGPFQSVEDADEALLEVQALGQNDVRIVVDPAG